jgi:hypothetical protein
MLKEFFAVTTTSVYHVQDHGQYGASAVKVALRGGSEIPVKTDIARGGMIAICHNLQAYVPERHGRSHMQDYDEQRVAKGKAGHWDFRTSGIVALFFDKEAASACLEAGSGDLCDARWLDSTKAVLAAIGDNHPSFLVSRDPELDLLRPAKRDKRSRVVG